MKPRQVSHLDSDWPSLHFVTVAVEFSKIFKKTLLYMDRVVHESQKIQVFWPAHDIDRAHWWLLDCAFIEGLNNITCDSHDHLLKAFLVG